MAEKTALPTRGKPAGILTLSGATAAMRSPRIKEELKSISFTTQEGETEEAYGVRLALDIGYIVLTNLDVCLPALVKLDNSVTLDQLEEADSEVAIQWVEKVLEENQPNLKAFTDFLGKMMAPSETKEK